MTMLSKRWRNSLLWIWSYLSVMMTVGRIEEVFSYLADMVFIMRSIFYALVFKFSVNCEFASLYTLICLHKMGCKWID